MVGTGGLRTSGSREQGGGVEKCPARKKEVCILTQAGPILVRITQGRGEFKERKRGLNKNSPAGGKERAGWPFQTKLAEKLLGHTHSTPGSNPRKDHPL